MKIIEKRFWPILSEMYIMITSDFNWKIITYFENSNCTNLRNTLFEVTREVLELLYVRVKHWALSDVVCTPFNAFTNLIIGLISGCFWLFQRFLTCLLRLYFLLSFYLNFIVNFNFLNFFLLRFHLKNLLRVTIIKGM